MKTQTQIQYFNGVNRVPTMIRSCSAGVPGTRYKTKTCDTEKIQMRKKYKLPKGMNRD